MIRRENGYVNVIILGIDDHCIWQDPKIRDQGNVGTFQDLLFAHFTAGQLDLPCIKRPDHACTSDLNRGRNHRPDRAA